MLEPTILTAYVLVLWALLGAALAAWLYRSTRVYGRNIALAVAVIAFAAVFFGPGLHAGLEQTADISVGLPSPH